ncbi:hypothetical protein GCM10009592_13100 [Brachybacterium rhamnosum]
MGVATALYRRYRPESFAEVIGQDHVTTPLRRALRNGRIGHAYLFSGPRGCGKTTSARILARCLNCAEGPTDTPCGTCDSCRDLARGGAGSLDVVEIDAASHGGVDDARELRERASFAPVRDRFKVFIIDEAHMVTSAGFNALLKLVEEPPEHVKFVFATTEPDKVIGTIRSRTHHYPFRLIPPQVLTPYLEQVCAAEDVHVGDGVLPLVVRAGGGSARDTMSVLDQLMAGAGDDGLDHATAIALLGFTDTALLDQAITAISARDAASLYDAVEQVLATGHEPRRFVEDLLERVRDLIVLAAVPERAEDLLPQVPADELASMREQAASIAPADLSRCGDLIHETLSTMSGATSPRLHLELLAARLVLRDERAAAAPAPGGQGGPAGQPGQGAPRGGQQANGRGQGAPAPQNGQGAPGADAAPTAGSGREEARRIAQERAEASRRTRGSAAATRPDDRREATGTAAPQAPAPQQAPAAREEPAAPQAPAQQQPAAAEQSAGQAPAASTGSRPATTWDPTPAADHDRAPARGGAAPVEEDPGQGAAQGAVAEESAAQAPAAQAPVEDAPSPAAPAGGPSTADVQGNWSAIMDELAQIRRPSWALIAQNAQLNAMNGTNLVIGFRTDGLVAAFHRGTAAENLADAVRRIMHVEVTVQAVVGDGPGGSGGPGPSGGPGGPGGQRGPGGQSGPSGQGGSGGQVGAGRRAGLDGQAGAGSNAGYGGRGGAAAQGGNAGQSTSGGPQGTRAQSDPAGSARGGSRPWGDLAASAGSTSRGAAAPSGRQRPAVDDHDLPPEPDDDEFPPDPEDSFPPDPQDQRSSAPSSAPRAAAPSASRGAAAASAASTPDASHSSGSGNGGGSSSRRWSDALPSAGGADAPTTGASAPGGSADEAPVVEDEGRDSVPEGEPRTYGQAAIRRAIAEGRVVRSRPAAHIVAATTGAGASTDVGASSTPAPGGPSGIDPSAPSGPAPSAPSADDPFALSDPSASDPGAPSAGSALSSGSAPSPASASDADGPAGAMGDASSSGGPSEGAGTRVAAPLAPGASQAVRPATAWGDAAPAAAPSAPRPQSTTAPAAPAAGFAPSAEQAVDDSAPRTGAALARHASQAARAAAADRRQQAQSRRPDEAPVPEAEVDPTGGASRDDEDAVVATRSGRQVIEAVLGGRVLEVIDETGDRR